MTLLALEPRAKRITHKNTRPVLIPLPREKDEHRIADMEVLIEANCRSKNRTIVGNLLQAFQLFKI